MMSSVKRLSFDLCLQYVAELVLILLLKLKFLISIFKFELYNLFLYYLHVNSKINEL